MGIIYEKSISLKYKKYFEQLADLQRHFQKYSMTQQRVITSGSINQKMWEKGEGGVPLAWEPDSDYIAVDHTDSHTLVIGSTGSKKSRLIAMPLVRILGSTHESMIICDPKAEIYNRTAGYLSRNDYEILVLNFRSPMYGKRWNLLNIPYDFFLGEI